ncbi:MAG: MFS transporter [Dehalococcoidia bacterium]
MTNPANPTHAAAAGPEAASMPRAPRSGRATELTIATGVALASLSFSVWWPFIPLYVLDLGATSDADALFWVAIATTAQGLSRLATGPFWGILSDRVGRKLIFLRSLFMASLTGVVMAFVAEPWQIALALMIQGIFSGFGPAGVALMSVTVPEHRLAPALSTVTGAQYLSATLGPALGSLLALGFGFKATILIASLLPTISGFMVLFTVPRDAVTPRAKKGETLAAVEPFHWTRQFLLSVFLLFVVYSTAQLIRTAAPITLKDITGNDDVSGLTGIAFTASGIASVVAIIVGAQSFFRAGRMRVALTATCAVSAAAYLLVAGASGAPMFLAGFVIVTMLQSAMIPAVNTLIANNVSRERRGTGFGIASSAQALSFAAGPLGAAAFAAVSFSGGFLAVGAFMLAVAALIYLSLREVRPEAPGAGT